MTAHEVLVAARNLLDREGWVQCKLGGPGVGFCVVGAVSFAASGDVYIDGPGFHEAGHALDEAVGLGDPYALADWNNSPERTKDEVLAAFDAAIAATAPAPDTAFLKSLPEGTDGSNPVPQSFGVGV